MNPNPLLGVCFHWLGGLASGSFYVPYRRVRNWAWETYWLVGGFFSWIIAPWALGLALTNDLVGVIARTPGRTLFFAWLFGAMWGFGGLTFGLTMRYLGMSLGMGVALGFCAAFGTLVPPIFRGQLAAIAASGPGRVTLLGVAICLAGIAIAALAGFSKEREMTEESKRAAIKEFSFAKGMLVATFSGVMSSFFAYGLDAGSPMSQLSAAAGTGTLWTGLPKLVVVLLGGFTTNLVWCVALNLRNRTAYQYVSRALRPAAGGQAGDAADLRIPRALNLFFCFLAGTTWYLQFFFYTMGETQMGRFRFSSWTLHMASIIIFSTMWGWILHEWKGASRRTHLLIGAGIAILILSTLTVGYGNYLNVNAR
ncbi:MAG: L-rhamnose/proton symporter RhaT [Opitutaceae bacterium]|jgi:L-rhamnose-H+ transport protein